MARESLWDSSNYRSNAKRIYRAGFYAHATAVAQATVNFSAAHVGRCDSLGIALADTGLADDVIPRDTGIAVYYRNTNFNSSCVSSINFYRTDFNAGLAEGTT